MSPELSHSASPSVGQPASIAPLPLDAEHRASHNTSVIATSSPSVTGSPSWRMSALRASVPAFLLMALCTGLRGMSLPQALAPAQQAGIQEIGSGVLSNGVLPPSQTLLVSAHQSSGTALLRARLQPSVDVVGRAPLSGQISRVMVDAGELVQVNDRILQISSGADARPPAPAERAQARAEQAQVAAAEAQEALQLRLQRAQKRLLAAQDRVERARIRVEEAQWG